MFGTILSALLILVSAFFAYAADSAINEAWSTQRQLQEVNKQLDSVRRACKPDSDRLLVIDNITYRCAPDVDQKVRPSQPLVV